jgi:four helix bundle protein
MTQKGNNIIQDKSYAFSLKIIKIYNYLTTEKKEFVLSKQILRCGTSIGANVEESIGAVSKKDFLNKMYIAYKETRETKYWINLLKDSSYISEEVGSSLLKDCEEILRILGKIISTSKINEQNF